MMRMVAIAAVGRMCRRCERTGQVLVVLLLGIALLAGLLFYVINVGDQVHRRLAMQNAADSAAVSGAAWMSRSMNVVAMNNVAQTRVLALVPHLDSFPLATKMTHEETAAWENCLARQLSRGVPDDWMRDGLESLRARMAEQRDILAPMDEFFNRSAFRVESLTNWFISGYGGPPPHGQLWQAAESLDEFSQATALSAGLLSQANAVRYGQKNYAEAAFVVPVLPELLARRTSFADFEKPVKKGLIPDRSYPHRLGPYDRLFQWRDYRYRGIYEQDQLVPGTPGHGQTRGSSGNVGIGGRRRGSSARGRYINPNERWTHRRVGTVLLGYSVYGPYEWMMERVFSYARRQLSDTFFFYTYNRERREGRDYGHYPKIADIKLGYMWGSQTLKNIHYPKWITDYPRAKAAAADPSKHVTRTMFYLVEIRSRYPKNAPGWLSPGSFVTNGERPIAIWVNDWSDPAEWGVPQIASYIWEDQYDYETTEDWAIGIRMQRDSDGNPVWQQVYMVAQYVFGGVDIGEDVEITNPANYTDRGDLSAPILMDTSVGDYNMAQPHHDLGVRRDVFTYLGVSYRNNDPMVWPERFGGGNPFGGVVGISQSEIFNTTSWDLWTQDWKARVVPVTQWGDWMDRMAVGAGDAAATGGMVDAGVVRDIGEYLGRFDELMVGEMLHH